MRTTARKDPPRPDARTTACLTLFVRTTLQIHSTCRLDISEPGVGGGQAGCLQHSRWAIMQLCLYEWESVAKHAAPTYTNDNDSTIKASSIGYHFGLEHCSKCVRSTSRMTTIVNSHSQCMFWNIHAPPHILLISTACMRSLCHSTSARVRYIFFCV